MISVFYYILERFQICRTWLNISEAQELDGATYETLKETYDHAMDSAKMAEHPKLQVTPSYCLCGGSNTTVYKRRLIAASNYSPRGP